MATALGTVASHRTAVLPTTGLGLWLDAADASTFTYSSSTLVSEWRDKSGNARHASQATTAKQPNRNGSRNGNASVVFDGTDDAMSSVTPATTVTDNYTIFVACWRAGANAANDNTLVPLMNGAGVSGNGYGPALRANSASFIGWLRGGNAWHTTTSTTPTGWVVLGLQRVAGTSAVYLNGVAEGSVPTAPSAPTMYSLGSSDAAGGAGIGFLNGQIGEVIVYGRALSTPERQQVEAYLTAKWVTAAAAPSYFTGGTVTDDGTWRTHTFTTSGTLTYVEGASAVSLQYLVVGGGGGGGCRRTGGGGGAGGYVASTATGSANQTITIGAGGAGGIGTSDVQGGDGTATTFGAVSATGGGGGGYAGTAAATGGRAGGSGGGGADHAAATGGTSWPGGIGSQGFNGGNGTTMGTNPAGMAGAGGGGAGAVGANTTGDSTLGFPGAGGNGLQWPSGSGTFYAGGGGGAHRGNNPGGAGGTGGGAPGTSAMNTTGIAATPNTGGGGGGASATTAILGGTGGSGIVIVRYPHQAGMP